jgi:zinc transport system substrate-binding protein
MKKVTTIIVLILIAIMILVLSFAEDKKIDSSKPQVTVSTFALYDISSKLLNNIADVSMLIPFGKDIHSYEMTPQDRVRVEKSSLFLYSGAGLEPWTKNFANHPHAIDMSQYVSLREASPHHHGDHEEHADHEADAHGDHAVDPHYWLDINNMIKMTYKLRDIFKETYPQKFSEQITANAHYYIRQLQSLDELYHKRLSTCKRDTIVVSHNAFGYLADRYGFHVMALNGLSPDAMPSAKDLAQISDLVHEKRITVLFNEPFESDRLIQSVAKVAKARVDVLQPLANITARQALEMLDYHLIMQLNLKKLYFALECE